MAETGFRDVGVRAVVKDLSSFKRDMGVVEDVVKGVVQTLLGLSSAGLTLVSSVAGGVGNTLKAIAKTVTSAFSSVFDLIKRIGSAAISPITTAFELLGGSLRRIFEIVSGILIAGTIRKLVSELVDLGKAALEAGAEFQLLKIRLEGLIARDLVAAACLSASA